MDREWEARMSDPFSAAWYRAVRHSPDEVIIKMDEHISRMQNPPLVDIDSLVPNALWLQFEEELCSRFSPFSIETQASLYRLLSFQFGRPASPLERSQKLLATREA